MTGINFAALAEDILHLVFTELYTGSPSSLLRLAQVSGYFKELILSDEESKIEGTEWMILRLLDDGDKLSQYVRHLCIKDFWHRTYARYFLCDT